jgi:hypothetical protein
MHSELAIHVGEISSKTKTTRTYAPTKSMQHLLR